MIFYEQKNILENDKTVEFEGHFNQQSIIDISEKIEYSLQLVNEKKRLNTLSYAIELISIFTRNSIDIFRNDCSFRMGVNESHITLYVSGIVSQKNADGFQEALNEINAAIGDKEKLQDLYREKLGNFTIDDRSGLGLLGIARRTGNPVLYNLEDFENVYAKFEILASVEI